MYSVMGMAAQAAADEGLTFQKVLESVPLDPLSIFAMGLMTVAFGAVVYFGIKSNAPDPSRPFRPALADDEDLEPTAAMPPATTVPVHAKAAAIAAVPVASAAASGEPTPVPVQDVVPTPSRPATRPNPVPVGVLAGRGAPGH